MNGCCGETPLTRFNGNGVFQESTDGGDTWVDAPQDDPRNEIPVFPPPAGDDGATKRCSAANSIVAFYQAKVADIQAGKDAAKDEAAMAAIVLGFLLVLGVFTAPWLLPALGVAVGAIISGLSAEAWAAAFTEDDYQRLICAFYEHLGADGQFDHDGYLAALGQVESDIADSTANDFFVGVTKGLGQTGLNTLAGLGMDAGLDCTCGCIAGWADGLVTTGQVAVDGDFIVLQVNEDGGDGHFYGQATRANSGDCCVCVDGSFDSGGSGFQAQIKECGSEDFSYPLFTGGGVNCWKVQIRCNDVSVYRFRPT